MKENKLLYLIIFLSLGLGCSDSRITSSYFLWHPFPLQTGMFWEYQNDDYDLHKRIITVREGPDGNLWYQMETTLMRKNDPIVAVIHLTFVRYEGGQLREYEYNDCTQIYNVLLQSPLSPGKAWLKYPSGTCPLGPCDSLGPCPIIIRINVDTRDSILSFSNLDTPAGFFANCIEIHESGKNFEFRQAWFKPGIGFVSYKDFNVERFYPDQIETVDLLLTSFGKIPGLKLRDSTPSPSPAPLSKAG